MPPLMGFVEPPPILPAPPWRKLPRQERERIAEALLALRISREHARRLARDPEFHRVEPMMARALREADGDLYKASVLVNGEIILY